MTSTAKTVAEYLESLTPERREAISAVRDLILENIDPAFEEGMSYGMIGYWVPHRLYPAGYHCNPSQPLPFANLASQKNYMSLYLMSLYLGEDPEWFEREWAKSGKKKLDRGKCCLRFKKLADLDLGIAGEAIRRMTAQQYIACYEASRKK
ncbi:DUF1801 domain-containing protein [Bryobacter aggregatus]|uniref:DUF1801 domain-containing protein n=1 Tax=Bryobacter aggregatus TaxID=360054 RepID=UPI0004E24627|nr:DUF1801 domain-containing protein [Bryobacter aggregatus]